MSTKTSALQDDYILEYFEALDCPRALTAWLMYSHKEHVQLTQLEFIPCHYNSIGHAADSLAATKFLSKATFLETKIDLKAVALKGFFEAELICKETNRRLDRCEFKNTLTPSILLRSAVKISQILGGLNAEDLVDSCNWGPGATTLTKRHNATHPEKFFHDGGITREAHDFVSGWFHLAYPLWDVPWVTQTTNKVVTVPKNSKTDRTIAIEPGMNLWFQKGIGTLFRRRLMAFGINLNDQTINQRKSRIAAKFNNLATVDFSMASDTICKRLVEELLPRNWFALLDVFRSKVGLVDGTPVLYEKFSSMGNGFTFELETLIFYAVAVACCEAQGCSSEGVSVYGDDVILPSCVFDLYSSITKDLGFTVNRSKSYSDGPYRESCGSHYWCGSNIKPIFQKEPISGKQSILKACNSVRRFAHSRNSHGCDRRLLRCWKLLSDVLGVNFPRISEGFGDLGIIENFDDSLASIKRATRGYEGYFVRLWAVQCYTVYCEHIGLLLSKLKLIGKNDLENERLTADTTRPDLASIGNEVPIPARYRYAKIRVLVPRWQDLGPWI